MHIESTPENVSFQTQFLVSISPKLFTFLGESEDLLPFFKVFCSISLLIHLLTIIINLFSRFLLITH